MESKDLATPGVQGQPQPLLIGLFADKTAEFVRLNLQVAVPRGLYVKVRGRRRVALDSETPSAMSCSRRPHGRCRAGREPFLEQSLDQRPALGGDPALRKLPDTLAATGFAPVVLLTVVDVAVLLVVRRTAPRANVSYDHDQRISL